MDDPYDTGNELRTVRCLKCGTAYTKPSAGGVVQMNPGCPDCGYAGWVSVSVEEPLPQTVWDQPPVAWTSLKRSK